MKKLLILPLFLATLSLAGQENNRNDYMLLIDDYMSLINTKIDLIELNNIVKESCYLTRSWVFIDKQSKTPDKARFLDIKNKDLKYLVDTLSILSNIEKGKFKQLINPILSDCQDLINYEFQITKKLSSFEDYDNVKIVMDVIPQVEYGSKLYEMKNSIIEKISLILMLIDLDINRILLSISRK